MNWQLHFGIASLTTILFQMFEERFYDKFYSVQVPPHTTPQLALLFVGYIL